MVLRTLSCFPDFPAPTGDGSNIALGFLALGFLTLGISALWQLAGFSVIAGQCTGLFGWCTPRHGIPWWCGGRSKSGALGDPNQSAVSTAVAPAY